MSIKIYEVGGSVRDQILGLIPKDRDFAVEATSFDEMHLHLKHICTKIYLIKPEFQTIRALHPALGPVDYVLCRKDGAYSDSRHPDKVSPGTILDDLARRDFTIGAMAINEQGKIIDPYNGQKDLKERVLRCVGSAEIRFNEDSLRILRALRFIITKQLTPDKEILDVFDDSQTWIPKLKSISVERRREELFKCFSYDTPETLRILHLIGAPWYEGLFKDLWLIPTNKQR